MFSPSLEDHVVCYSITNNSDQQYHNYISHFHKVYDTHMVITDYKLSDGNIPTETKAQNEKLEFNFLKAIDIHWSVPFDEFKTKHPEYFI